MALKHTKVRTQPKKAQIILEFLFSMIIVFVMMFGLFMIFRWVGYEFGWRRVEHDQRMLNSVVEDYRALDQGPIEQIDPYFHKPAKMNAAWGL